MIRIPSVVTGGRAHEQIVGLMFEAVEIGQAPMEESTPERGMAGGYELFPGFDSYRNRAKGWLESRSGKELQDFPYERLDKDFDLRDRERMEKVIWRALDDGLINRADLV